MSKVSRIILAATFALAAGGCSATIQGTPSTTPSRPALSSEANPLAALKPCDLLGQMVQGLNYPPVAPDIVNKELACSTRKSDGADIALLLNPGVPFTEQPTNAGSSRPGNIHGRRALQMRDLGKVKGGCAVRLEVNPQANVVITAVSDTAAEQDCQLVDQLATRLEPMLPKN
ncbi:DUF3558 family protein [Amycolatopsis sp. CA-230715]|uniref:DUF3558 family protein n=1 Tax=Amycolatopsis sp. CA-230715 TaxID=2745196 RepID=UPI001C013E98|nr:DUF3558 family protein [Amycolatopsis sp. CA-230715]